MGGLHTVGDQLFNCIGIDARLAALVDAPRLRGRDTFKLPLASIDPFPKCVIVLKHLDAAYYATCATPESHDIFESARAFGARNTPTTLNQKGR
jgi:hypothetical protein